MLRAFPKSPGSSIWVVQNLEKRTEYECDVEQMTCTCRRFEHQHKCEKHLPYALQRAKLYGGDRAVYEEFVGKLLRAA